MEWISVKAQLPNYGTVVFLKDTKEVFVGYRDSTSKKGENYLIMVDEIRDRGDEKITHWMKLELPNL